MLDDLDAFELDLDGFDEDALEQGGELIPAGRYHAEILSVIKEDQDRKTPCIVLKLAILAGEHPEAVGRLLYERLYVSEKTRQRINLFAVRLGLAARADAKDPDRKRPTVNWNDVVGRQVVIDVHDDEYTKKDGTKAKASRVKFAGVWSVDDPRVGDVPKDGEALQRPRQAPPAAEDNFDDL
jgi:hypothetical protein